MGDPIQILLAMIEKDLRALPAADLSGPAAGDGREAKFKARFGRPLPAGLAALWGRTGGGVLGPEARLLSWDESVAALEAAGRAGEMKGLWPFFEWAGRRFALDAEGAAGDEEWPVVEVLDRSVDRVGTSVLRFVHTQLAELLAKPESDPVDLSRELCRRDPGIGTHWLELAEELDVAGRAAEADSVLAEGLRAASPLGPCLPLAIGLRAYEAGDVDAASAAFRDALALDPMCGRDDDARLDAAAFSAALALERGESGAADRIRSTVGVAAASTGSYWRGEAMRAWARGRPRRAALAARVVRLLVPEDADVARMEGGGAELVPALTALQEARDALDRGAFDEALRAARAGVAARPDLGVAHAMLAEALNARRDRGALQAAERSTQLNPALVEGWRELGDAHLELHQAPKAEEAYRRAIACDGSYGLAHAKLAQALLEQGRTGEAFEAIGAASERGGDAFFLAAVRGDILAEMRRHGDAADAYDQALRIEPDDHWVLHQAAIEHGRAGNDGRACELFERAMTADREGCHQTLIDYGDLLRRVGRIGDAVRLYRRAVAAAPSESGWRQALREAERELHAAPN